MPAWIEDIPKEDSGWRQITLSSNRLTGSNVRFSPVVLANNVTGTILHDSVNGSIKGLANPAYKYEDGQYTWYPCHILGSGIDEEAQVWIAIEAYVLNLGAYINVPPPAPVDESEFFDVDFLGQPTLHIPASHMASVVEVLHAVANYFNAKFL